MQATKQLLFVTTPAFTIVWFGGLGKAVRHFLFYHKSVVFFFLNHTGKPNESRVQFPENFQRQKQSSNCVFVVYSSRPLFYTYTRVRQLTNLNYCNLAFINDLKIWSELVGLLQLKINWSKMSYPMTFLQIKFFNKKERGGSGGQIRYLLSLADLRLLFSGLNGSAG